MLTSNAKNVLISNTNVYFSNKRHAIRDNGKVQSHDLEERKLNSAIMTNSGVQTFE